MKKGLCIPGWTVTDRGLPVGFVLGITGLYGSLWTTFICLVVCGLFIAVNVYQKGFSLRKAVGIVGLIIIYGLASKGLLLGS